jgi:hypothetical protein
MSKKMLRKIITPSHCHRRRENVSKAPVTNKRGG